MNIETKRFVLRALEPEDASFLASLVNDPEVRDALGAYDLVFPVSVDAETKWIVEASKKDDQAHLVITKKSDSTPLGLLSVKDLNSRNASGHLSIILERKSWDKGYGTEVLKGTLEFLFDKMNFHRIWLRVSEGNHRAIRCYEKCGFSREGMLREDHFAHGGWKNSFIMSVLSEEYRMSGK